MPNRILTALIVDDEPFAVTNLSNLIASYCPSFQILDTAGHATEAIAKIDQLRPQVLFLDINMPGKSGFDLLNELSYMPLVVFVTAHEQFAIKAMKVSAVDFLLKPIDINELIQTEARLKQLQSIRAEIGENYSHVLRNLADTLQSHNAVNKITVLGTRGYEMFETEHIQYITGEDNYSTFHLINNRETVVARTLKDFEEMLEGNGFMRIHKSSLVNLSHVKKVIRKENVELQMSDEVILSVSRRRVHELLEWAKQQLKG